MRNFARLVLGHEFLLVLLLFDHLICRGQRGSDNFCAIYLEQLCTGGLDVFV